MSKIVLKNATVMTDSGFKQTQVLIDGPYIAKIDPNINDSAQVEIDCSGKLVLPGLIDAHVHFRQPGMEHKATIKTESAAAALGGVTSFMDMPNTSPATTTIEALHNKQALASNDSYVNYGFYLGASEHNLEEVKRVDPNEIAGIKIYMGSTTGNLLLDDDNALFKMFEAAPTLVATHCEDNGIINANTALAKEMYGDKIPFEMHHIIRNRDCCVKSSLLAIEAAKATNKRLHIMHLSSQEEVELLSQYAQGDIHNRQISAEVCIPHLFFNDTDYPRLKGFLKCNPAVKFERDRRALIQGLRKGIITTIGTDHAPHELTVKQSDNYLNVASGLPSVQFSLNVIFELFKRKELSLEEGIKAATINVAERFGIEKRGLIKEGYFADIAIIDPRERYTVHQDDIASLCKWSPMLNQSFSCKVTHTIASGNLVVADSKLCSDSGNAMALRFNPQPQAPTRALARTRAWPCPLARPRPGLA